MKKIIKWVNSLFGSGVDPSLRAYLWRMEWRQEQKQMRERHGVAFGRWLNNSDDLAHKRFSK